MAKIYGLNGVLTGKQGNTVFSVTAGQVVAKQYQPIVANPSTEKQVASRARFKLMSEVAAICAPVVAIPREGLVSSRNRFAKINYDLTSYTNNTATINLAALQLTQSAIGLPELTTTVTGAQLEVKLGLAARELTRVVYVMFQRGDDEKLRIVGSSVVDTPGDTYLFPYTGFNVRRASVVLAYGMRDNTETARATFSQMTVPTAEMIGTVIATRVLTVKDVTVTETNGVIVTPGT